MVLGRPVVAFAVVSTGAGVDDGLTESGNAVQEAMMGLLGDLVRSGQGKLAVGYHLDLGS
jgi:hypothetical protein